MAAPISRNMYDVSANMDDEFEWRPPSASERKLIEARRERSDRISKLMGDYLLKGYKMLQNTCDVCETILLETKQGVKYCVACSEIDPEICKDDPVRNLDAARSQVAESSAAAQYEDEEVLPVMENVTSSQKNIQYRVCQTNVSHVEIPPVSSFPLMSSKECTSSLDGSKTYVSQESVKVLCDKIIWCTEKLKSSTCIETCIQYCKLIKASAEAIESIKHMN